MKQHTGKIIAVAAVLLMLPVLFILMLPSLIFGGLTSSGIPGQTILNDNTAIIQNMNDISLAVDQALGEGITDVEARIAQDFASASGDNYEIINPYASDRTSETRTVEADDPETTDVVETKEETWYIYTISYNGEEYFADTVFHLSASQKELADNYAENLSLFLGDGTLQYAEYGGNTLPALGEVRFTDGSTDAVYFNQLDERYANKPYGTDNI